MQKVSSSDYSNKNVSNVPVVKKFSVVASMDIDEWITKATTNVHSVPYFDGNYSIFRILCSYFILSLIIISRRK